MWSDFCRRAENSLTVTVKAGHVLSHGKTTAAAFPDSLLPTTKMSDRDHYDLRAKYTRFRILVIGRANAGKTTLLQRVCNTTEDPCIYDDDKNLVSFYRPEDD